MLHECICLTKGCQLSNNASISSLSLSIVGTWLATVKTSLFAWYWITLGEKQASKIDWKSYNLLKFSEKLCLHFEYKVNKIFKKLLKW